MFKDENAEPLTPEQEMLGKIIQELDEIKRYSGGTYENTDNEISELINMCRKIETKVDGMDRQINKIESFERQLNEIKSVVQRLERKN